MDQEATAATTAAASAAAAAAAADSPLVRRPAPRLYHKKSRLGCLRCKGRRVKCDERRPVCSGCARHDVECVYVYPAAGDAAAGPGPGPGTANSDRASPPKRRRAADAGGYNEYNEYNEHNDAGSSGADADAFPESRSRRLTEMRLLHRYLLTQSRTFGQPLGVPPQHGYVWSNDLVARALAGSASEECAGATERHERHERHDGILYALLAHAALGVWMGTDETASAAGRDEHRQLHQQYLSMALRAQRRAVDALVSLAENMDSNQKSVAALADNVGSAALLLVNHSFALVQTLPVEPWQPPHEWLQMGRGAMQVMEVAKEYLGLGLGLGPRPADSSAPSSTATRSSVGRATVKRALTTVPLSTSTTTPASLVVRLAQSAPHFDPADMFSPVWAAPYLWLLEEPADPADPAEHEVDERHRYQGVPGLYNPDRESVSASSAGSAGMRVYYETLSYIGWCAAAAQRRDEPLNAICRRMAAASYWFPQELEERLEERRPRALVCLAQFFALWIPFEFTGRFADTPSSGSASSLPEPENTGRPVWMMGTAGRRQVAAIHAALPARWKSKVEPLLSTD